jgi:hypothetical protein
MSTVEDVGLKNSIHPAGVSALGCTSLMRIAGAFDTVIDRDPT